MCGSAELISQLGLSAHPEGGHYRETYRASEQVNTPRGHRAASTAILFLLAAGGTLAGTGSAPMKPGTFTVAGAC
jgi:predicted cupin superfamily sugar epimerase